MHIFEGKTITGRMEAFEFADASFVNCTFDNCAVGPGGPERRPLVRNIELRAVAQCACSLSGARIEDCSLLGLKKLGRGPLFFWGTVFKHVKLSGRLSAMKINRLLNVPATKHQAAWDDSCLRYYSNVDWALDIRDAEFQGSISLEAIPGSLIRRDQETQALVTRERLLVSDWKNVVQNQSGVRVAIEWFLEDSLFPDVVLVASKGTSYFKHELAALESLRREGIAD
jgi:hypothetical protein